MRIGVDLGGSKIEAALLAADGTIAYRDRVPTPRNYEAAIAAVSALVDAASSEGGGRRPVGVGIPGSISPATGLVRNANSTWLNGRRLDRDLAAALDRPVRLANDANCFALSEAADGAGAGAGSVFGVILGTGVGGGLVIRGQLHEGVNAVAGEWGHNPLPWPQGPEETPGPECWCGRRGCIETFLSGPGLARDHAARTGDALDAEAIVAAAAGGDADCEASLARYEDRLARALAHMINIADPEAVVLGGGLSNFSRLYQSVPALWRRWVFSDHVATRLLPPAHGDSSGVRGAAWLWPADAEP